jgi:hypothetical protein
LISSIFKIEDGGEYAKCFEASNLVADTFLDARDDKGSVDPKVAGVSKTADGAMVTDLSGV